MFTVDVRFAGNPKEYKYLHNNPVKKGDKVVVKSPLSGFEVVTVTRDSGVFFGNFRNFKRIVDVVDMTEFNKKEARDYMGTAVKRMQDAYGSEWYAACVRFLQML